jgi:cytoskeletal protein CcmA (bactofilin family)
MLQKLVRNVTSSNAATPHAGILSVISPNVRIVGDIVSQGEVHVDGQIDGNITCQSLTIGEGARISGEVTADSVRIHGELSGKVNSPLVSITKTARVTGDVIHESLEIELGAYFEGHCIRRPGSQSPDVKRMIEAAPPTPTPATPPSSGKKAAAEDRSDD